MKISKSTLTPVYPRVCGGTAGVRALAGDALGLSPRVRGNRYKASYRPVRQKSIPACAGEPILARNNFTLAEVYPRVCRGTMR